MDPRYTDQRIVEIAGDASKLLRWQATELAVILARVEMGIVPREAYETILRIWTNTPIDIAWWKERDAKIHHDLNAFIDERVRHLPPELHQYVHKGITSYDTEEPAFAVMLGLANGLVFEQAESLLGTLRAMALRYRYTIMNARTHAQEAVLKSFGARILTWYADLNVAIETLRRASEKLVFSKISGAVGNYEDIDPALEERALAILGLRPYYGATQIMPRVIYAPVAEALADLVMVINKIATDIRLNARSGRPLMREPFAKRQKGSSAMPHKKNPILSEQVGGMARMANGFLLMIRENIVTWEERTIEQSSVERVGWPDLYHVTLRALTVLNKVLSGLQVYAVNMLREAYESRGVYASGQAKELLKRHLPDLGHEAAYRIVQLACFNVFEPSAEWMDLNGHIPGSFDEARAALERVAMLTEAVVSIREFIPAAELRPTDELDISPEMVAIYNERLRQLFADPSVLAEWKKLFDPAFLLRNEGRLYKEILGVE